jgi:hypothetical protein
MVMSIMKNFWFCFFIAAIIIALTGPGWMPISAFMVTILLGYAAILSLVFKNFLKNPKRELEKYAKKKRLTVNVFQMLGNNPKRFLKIYFFPFAGAMSGLSLFSIIFAVVTVTIPDSRLEFLEFIPHAASGNQAISLTFIIAFASLVVFGCILTLIRLYSTLKGPFMGFVDEINALGENNPE